MKAQMLKRSSNIAGTIKTSLAMVIPILFIGSITVLLNIFPVQGKGCLLYQGYLYSPAIDRDSLISTGKK